MSGELREIQDAFESLRAELDLAAIWLDSENGPSPESWTDEMWTYYIASRQAVA